MALKTVRELFRVNRLEYPEDALPGSSWHSGTFDSAHSQRTIPTVSSWHSQESFSPAHPQRKYSTDSVATILSNSPARTPAESSAERYLKLTEECLVQADTMTSFCSSPSPKFNPEQCKYLSYKLKMAVQNAHLFLEQIKTWYSMLASSEDKGRSLEIFKLLFALGKEVQSFIQSCCNDELVESAITLTSGLEHVSSICFNLQLCTLVFSKRKSLGSTPSLTVTEVASVRQAEDEIVKKMANIDERRLREKLRIKPGGELATFLHGRLYSRGLHQGSESSGSFQSFSHSEINASSLKRMEKLGEGAFGTVHKAMWLGAAVAMKTLHGPDNPDFVQEVSILAGLCHPNIVYMFGYRREEHKCQIIMELMDGDLNSVMQERLEEFGSDKPPFTIAEGGDIMLQVAEAVCFLHEKKIVHRDLKSQNILVRRGKATDTALKYMQVKVADFGLSKTKEKSRTYSDQTPNMGTARWMAPELIRLGNNVGEVQLSEDEKYPFRSDVYSFGMVCYEILTGHVPFPKLSAIEVKRVVLIGQRPQLPDQCPRRLRNLIGACWSPKASNRPDFGEICAELRQMKYEHIMRCAWADVPRCFSLDEIRRMTNGLFSNDGFEDLSVREAVIVDTGEVVAVQVVGVRDPLNNRIGVFVGLDHRNLLRCIGFCCEEGQWILVYEGMPKGTLRNWLCGDIEGDVNYELWSVRKKICLGVANGIHYLHAECIPKITNGGINADTILLDANLEPKIAACSRPDYLPIGMNREYMAPEYIDGQSDSEKVDVYSCGVVLLDIVQGGTKRHDHLERVWTLAYEERTKEIDPRLKLQPNEEMEALRIIKIAFLCMQEVPERRPDISLVLAMLQERVDAQISIPLLEFGPHI